MSAHKVHSLLSSVISILKFWLLLVKLFLSALLIGTWGEGSTEE